MTVVHLAYISAVDQFSSLARVAWQIDFEYLIRHRIDYSCQCLELCYLSHQLPVHGTEGDDPAGPAGEAHQEVSGGGGEGDTDCTALKAVGGVAVAKVVLPEAVETNYCSHGKVGRDQSN